MTALAKERNTVRRDADFFAFPVAAATRIFAGAVVAMSDTALAVPGATATGLHGVGIAQETADNREGGNGELMVKVRRGCFLLSNEATDPITRADVGRVCYMVDDQTVAKTDGTGTRSPAGVVRDVENGVWVEF